MNARQADSAEKSSDDSVRETDRNRSRDRESGGRSGPGRFGGPVERLHARHGNQAVQRLVDDGRLDSRSERRTDDGDESEPDRASRGSGPSRTGTGTTRARSDETWPGSGGTGTGSGGTGAGSGGTGSGGVVYRLCARCSDRLRAGEPLDCPECERTLQRSADAGHEPTVPESVGDELQARRGQGRPLPDSIRAEFEPLFGYDFGDVSVHRDAAAARLSDRLDARAFAYGRDVYVPPGNYRPDSDAGRGLLAHELAHVVQQDGPVRRKPTRVSQPSDRHEREADRAADRVLAESRVGSLGTPAEPVVSRNGGPLVSGSGQSASTTGSSGPEETSEEGPASLTPAAARALDDVALVEEINRYRRMQSSSNFGEGEREAARLNLAILEMELQNRLQYAPTSTSSGAGGEEIVLHQVREADVPSPIVSSLPEGQLVEVSPGEFGGLYGGFGGPYGGFGGQYGGPGGFPGASGREGEEPTPQYVGQMSRVSGSGMRRAANGIVTRRGFQAAGQHAIGIVTFPQARSVRGVSQLGGVMNGRRQFSDVLSGLARPGPVFPESSILFGHTAVYTRVDGEIRLIRSFAPASQVDAVGNLGDLYSGGGVDAAILDHLRQGQPGGSMFDKASARTVEFELPRNLAVQATDDIPESGRLPSQFRYVAKPENFSGDGCGRNCVIWAEEMFGSSVGEGGTLPIYDEAGRPITNVTTSGESASRAGRQGVLHERLIQIESGNADAPRMNLPDGTSARGVAGRMPRSIRYLRFGGTVFTIAGYGYSAHRVATAPEGQVDDVIAEEAAGHIGGEIGTVLGVAGCGLLGVATSGLGLAACGLAGGLVGGVGSSWAAGQFDW